MAWKWFAASAPNRVTFQSTMTAPRNFALVSYDKDDDFGRIFELCDRLRASMRRIQPSQALCSNFFDVPPKPSRADDRREGLMDK